jgi:segregation and condensation protein B
MHHDTTDDGTGAMRSEETSDEGTAPSNGHVGDPPSDRLGADPLRSYDQAAELQESSPNAEPTEGDSKDAEAGPDDGSESPADETEAIPTPTDEQEAFEGIEAESVVEAILFATDSPLPPARIAQIMGVGDARTVRKHIGALNDRYERNGAAFRIEEIAGGYQMLTLPKFNPWLAKLLRARQESRLSPAALETLAIVAYKQPVLRAEIEAIRGVAVGEVLNRLREMNLIKIVGRDEQIGRPMLYGTTKRFLEVFGLASLKDLPTVEELKRPE